MEAAGRHRGNNFLFFIPVRCTNLKTNSTIK
jgi:hypothetical protein